jgi:hypothetical protein
MYADGVVTKAVTIAAITMVLRTEAGPGRLPFAGTMILHINQTRKDEERMCSAINSFLGLK